MELRLEDTDICSQISTKFELGQWVYPSENRSWDILSGVIASDFKVSSKETYKTNIRPVTFST